MPRCHDQQSCNGRTVSPCFSSNRDKQSAFSGFIKARERPGQENHRQENTDGDTRTETTPRTKKANETERTKGEEQGIKKKNRERTGGGGENTKDQRNFWQGNSYFFSSDQTTDSAKSNAQPKGETKKKRKTQRERDQEEEVEQERRERGSREHKKKGRRQT
ncbi:hypothetical protein BDE02_01G356900 [Populus trichocarpa]|nr:hypothetical protein BDE02_01G356900 [Populus trichocarpa]